VVEAARIGAAPMMPEAATGAAEEIGAAVISVAAAGTGSRRRVARARADAIY
jgi:hypothetical protein